MTSPEQNDRDNFRKERVGIVLSDKMQKTIVVQIRRKALHPEYGKVIEKAGKFKVHDEKNVAKIGDRVRIGRVEERRRGYNRLKRTFGAAQTLKYFASG